MPMIAIILLGSAGAFWLLGFAGFAIASAREGERRAARTAALLALAGIAPAGAAWALPDAARPWAALLLLVAAAIASIVLLVPFRRATAEPFILPPGRRDEREIMFSRIRLRPHTPEHADFYGRRPEALAGDNIARANPGLLSPEAQLGDRRLFAAPHGSFFLTDALREAVDGPVVGDPLPMTPAEGTVYLKGLARYFGARDAGVARLEPAHYYSHIGRGTGRYGDPVAPDHAFALVFTVEMAPEMIAAAPRPPAVMESARQYVEAARIAVPLAAALRALGHPARAHIDGNYRVIAPLAAREAGLGEIGRLGLLMSPRQGPRVRIGLVSTSLELTPDGPRPDPSLVDFCRLCRKCAEACPAQAIPHGDKEEVDSVRRWRIDEERCFRFWTSIGTDCGRCIAVCPYAHPDGAFHRLVRRGLRTTRAFRRAALAMDDLFYGRKPQPRPAPAWTQGDKAGPGE